MKSKRRAIAGRVAVTLAFAVVATTVMGASAAIAAENLGSVGITVSVTAAPGSDSSAVTNTNTNSGAGAGAGASTSKAPVAPVVPGDTKRNTTPGAATVVTPAKPSTTPVAAPGEFNLGGLLFLSGVSTDYGWSINPLGGEAHSHFTVHNVSTETIDSTANFSVVGPFGNEIARVDGITISQLKPDESRVVDANLTGLGQWTFYTIHATLVPPATVQGTALTPVTRDGFLFVLPWFVLVLMIFGVGAYSVVRIVRNAEFGAASGEAAGALAGGAA